MLGLSLRARACWLEEELQYSPSQVFKQALFVSQCNPLNQTILAKQISHFNKDRNSSPDSTRLISL